MSLEARRDPSAGSSGAVMSYKNRFVSPERSDALFVVRRTRVKVVGMRLLEMRYQSIILDIKAFNDSCAVAR